MLNASFLSRVGECSSNVYLIAVKSGINKGQLRAAEESVDKFVVDADTGDGTILRYILIFLCRFVSRVQFADEDGDIGICRYLGCDNAIEIPQLGANMVTDGRCVADQGRGLTTSSIDDCDRLVGGMHEPLGRAKGQ